MLHDVVEVEVRGKFTLWLRFEDGLEGEVDLSELAGQGVFQRWEERPEEFSEAALDPERGTVVWPGGLDVAPDHRGAQVLKELGIGRVPVEELAPLQAA